jgi:hypothetical protein
VKHEFEPGQKVYVGLMSGKVVRVREFQGIQYIDVEIDGVITDYTVDQVQLAE